MDASNSVPLRLDDLLHALEALFSVCGRNGRQKFVKPGLAFLILLIAIFQQPAGSVGDFTPDAAQGWSRTAGVSSVVSVSSAFSVIAVMGPPWSAPPTRSIEPRAYDSYES